jgi:hypothetical protein
MTRRVRSGMSKETSETKNQEYPYVWFWMSRLPERKGEPCRVVARGKMNSILVEFEDRFRVVTSRYAIRKAILHK